MRGFRAVEKWHLSVYRTYTHSIHWSKCLAWPVGIWLLGGMVHSSIHRCFCMLVLMYVLAVARCVCIRLFSMEEVQLQPASWLSACTFSCQYHEHNTQANNKLHDWEWWCWEPENESVNQTSFMCPPHCCSCVSCGLAAEGHAKPSLLYVYYVDVSFGLDHIMRQAASYQNRCWSVENSDLQRWSGLLLKVDGQKIHSNVQTADTKAYAAVVNKSWSRSCSLLRFLTAQMRLTDRGRPM